MKIMKAIKNKKVEIIIENNYKIENCFGFKIKYLSKKILKEILNIHKIKYDVSISILLVSNYKIKKINNKYRQINKSTDVLSFPMYFFKNGIIEKNKIYGSLKTMFLGDIVFSVDKCISQSKKYNHSIKREFSFLVTHSILHLINLGIYR